MQGKVVLITGGAKRVGAATCRRLHSAGANLMLHYRVSAGEARLLQAELNHQRKDSVALIQADLLDTAKLPAMVEQTVLSFGRLDALINNASSFFQTPVGEITAAAWEDLIGTNLRAPLFLSQAAAPASTRSRRVRFCGLTTKPSTSFPASASSRIRRSSAKGRRRTSPRPCIFCWRRQPM